MSDEIREQFEKEFPLSGGISWYVDMYVCVENTFFERTLAAQTMERFLVYKTGHSSRDEEVADLKNIIKNRSGIMDAWQEEIADLVVENKKLRESHEKIIYLEKDYHECGHKDSAPRCISKMGDISSKALKGNTDKSTWDLLPEVKEALKDGE